MKAAKQRADHFSEVLPEFLKCLHCGLIARDCTRQVNDLALYAGAALVIPGDGSGRNEVFHDSALVGKIPNFAAAGDAGPAGHQAALHRKRRADSRTQRESHGAVETARRSGADLAQQVRIGIVQKAHFRRRPAEARSQSLA